MKTKSNRSTLRGLQPALSQQEGGVLNITGSSDCARNNTSLSSEIILA